MNLEVLSIAFSKIEQKIEHPHYLKSICITIVNKTTSRQLIKEVLDNEGVNLSVAKVGFLHLIFEYIKDALNDNILTATEKENIKYLKLLFNIKPGDFYMYNKTDVVSTITFQLSRIYNDSFISDEEALLKVDLQEIFDLSFDEMNNLSKVEAAVSVQKGFDVKDLDIYFSQKEFYKLNSR